MLKGWNHNSQTSGKSWQFIFGEARYGDDLLHFTIKLEQAKSLLSREEKFYRPGRMPSVNAAEKETIMRVQEIHDRSHHASSNEMTQVITANPRVFNADAVEIKLWKEKTG